MARKQVNGLIPYIGATFGPATNITAITNAASAVATFAAGHGIVVGDYVELTASGWPLLANRVFRASAVSTNDITLLGADTTDTNKFPAGGGAGSNGRRIITRVPIQQVNADQFSQTGGQYEFEDFQYIDIPIKGRYPTVRSPLLVEMVVDDDQTQSYWATVRAAQASLTNTPILVQYPGGGGWEVGTGIWTISGAPELKGNSVQKRTISVSMAGEVTEYTS